MPIDDDDPTVFWTEHDQLLVVWPGEHRLAESFRRFHHDNPEVYETLLMLARRWAKRRPGQDCGIGMLYEVARWTLSLRTEGEPLKLNNNYRAFYARLLMENESDLNGIFHTRRQRA